METEGPHKSGYGRIQKCLGAFGVLIGVELTRSWPYAQVAMSFAPFSASVMSTIVNLYIGLPVVVTTGRL